MTSTVPSGRRSGDAGARGGSNGRTAGDETRPRLSLLQAVLREWPIFLAPIVLLTVLAIVAGLVRSPQYTASTQVAVGRIDVSAPGALAGFTEATEALASSYSRAVNANAVTTPVGQRLRMDPTEVGLRLSATPVPQSPVFTVYAVGDSADQAVNLANLATEALVRYVDTTNSSEARAREIYAEYKEAARVLARRRVAADSLDVGSREDLSAAEVTAVSDAEAETQAAKLRVDALQARYRLTQQAAPSASLVQILRRAGYPTSDLFARLQFFVFVALVLGTAIGLGLALLRANRRAGAQLL